MVERLVDVGGRRLRTCRTGERAPAVVFEAGDDSSVWRTIDRVHVDFVAAAPEARELVLARGNGHYVMRDRPEVVLDAVARMIERVRTADRLEL